MSDSSGLAIQASDAPRNFCLIIGAMKSGTTSLFELLAQHPEVSPCREKEPSFFCYPERVAEGFNNYAGLWHWDEGRHRIALEASTQYAKAPWYPGVPERISAADAATFRFIYMVRHPLRRIESQVRHSLYEGWGKTLDEGLSEDAVDFSRYAMQLDQFMKHFSRDQFLIVVLEDFHRQPEVVLERVCSFMDISPGFAFVEPDKTRNSGDFFGIPPVLAAIAKHPWAANMVRAMPPRMKRGLRETLSRLGRSRNREDLGRWRLRPAEEDEILRRLAGDLERLRDVYGVDTAHFWEPSFAPSDESRGRDAVS